MMKLPVTLCLLLLAGRLAVATPQDRIAANVSNTAVQAAIDAAVDGDRVVIPPGSADWTSVVTKVNGAITTIGGVVIYNKAITLEGGGQNSTIITHKFDTVANSALINKAAIAIDGTGTKAVRVTGLTITAGDKKTDTNISGLILVGAGRTNTSVNRNVRIDNVTLNQVARGIKWAGYSEGLMDHDTFNGLLADSAGAPCGSQQFVTVDQDGGTAWMRPFELGAAAVDGTDGTRVHTVVLETSTINNPVGVNGDGAVEGYNGARYVVRYCTINNIVLGMHGLDSGGLRAPVSWEFYENFLNFTDPAAQARGLQSRGGSGVMYNNTVNTTNASSATLTPGLIHLQLYRAEANSTLTGLAGYGGDLQPFSAIIGTKTVSSNTTNQSVNLTAASGAPFVAVWYGKGKLITGSGIPPNTYISTRNSDTSLTMSNPATATATTNLTFTNPVDGNTNSFGYPALDATGAAAPTTLADGTTPVFIDNSNIPSITFSPGPSGNVTYQGHFKARAWNNVRKFWPSGGTLSAGGVFTGTGTSTNVTSGFAVEPGASDPSRPPTPSDLIQAGRDYDNTQPTGGEYTALVYPHPRITAVPQFTSAPITTFSTNGGTQQTFLFTTANFTGTPTLVKTGALPGGVTFTDNGTGSANITGQPSGSTADYPLTITATSGAQVVPQSFNLHVNSPNQLPTVTLTAPTAGPQGASPLTIPLAATASDPDGKITSVEFYRGTTLIGTYIPAPTAAAVNATYSGWSGVTTGSYSITAKAYDDGGAVTTSAAVAISVYSAATITPTPAVIQLGTPPAIVIPPKGVYSLTTADSAIANSGVLNNANVDGVSIRTHWNALETADGTYNWTYLDGQVARCVTAGKSISLRVGTGSGDATRGNAGNVPGWVIDQITASVGGTANDTHYFHFNDTNSGVPDRAIPTFWEPIFVQKKREMLTALGAHFAGNANIKIVYIGFSNAQSTDWSVPDSTTVDGLGAAGSSERSRWITLGYTAQKVIDAGCPASGTTGIIDAAAAAFPNAYVDFSAGRNSFTASGSPSMSGLDPSADYPAQTALTNARAKYGSRALVQLDKLAQKVADNQPFSGQPGGNNGWTIIYNNRPNVGAQMLTAVTGASGLASMSGVADGGASTVLTDAVDEGAKYGTLYQEIYQTDITNSGLTSVIAHAHAVLNP